MLDTLQATTFEPLEGQPFRLRHGEDADIEATLVETKRIGEESSASGRAPFSLLFACSALVEPVQGLFHFEHETLGALDLFLVPVGQDKRGLLLEAVFN